MQQHTTLVPVQVIHSVELSTVSSYTAALAYQQHVTLAPIQVIHSGVKLSTVQVINHSQHISYPQPQAIYSVELSTASSYPYTASSSSSYPQRQAIHSVELSTAQVINHPQHSSYPQSQAIHSSNHPQRPCYSK